LSGMPTKPVCGCRAPRSIGGHSSPPYGTQSLLATCKAGHDMLGMIKTTIILCWIGLFFAGYVWLGAAIGALEIGH
jgi:hypothetical protein